MYWENILKDFSSILVSLVPWVCIFPIDTRHSWTFSRQYILLVHLHRQCSQNKCHKKRPSTCSAICWWDKQCSCNPDTAKPSKTYFDGPVRQWNWFSGQTVSTGWCFAFETRFRAKGTDRYGSGGPWSALHLKASWSNLVQTSKPIWHNPPQPVGSLRSNTSLQIGISSWAVARQTSVALQSSQYRNGSDVRKMAVVFWQWTFAGQVLAWSFAATGCCILSFRRLYVCRL